jgi:hypothetical protein
LKPPQQQKNPPLKNCAVAPLIFFDVAPAFGTVNGVAMIELAAPLVIPQPDGSVLFEMHCVAKLRCTGSGLLSLKQAVEQILTMHAPPATAKN